jgi:hypothetical protein
MVVLISCRNGRTIGQRVAQLDAAGCSPLRVSADDYGARGRLPAPGSSSKSARAFRAALGSETHDLGSAKRAHIAAGVSVDGGARTGRDPSLLPRATLTVSRRALHAEWNARRGEAPTLPLPPAHSATLYSTLHPAGADRCSAGAPGTPPARPN